ncbi:GDSL-type esterase/lipase family protein [Cohnella hashimotonis]|uniref:GDSL-type esterase/lipase family protein n=1 Tax=Cohnella hashimotonis TaxID=2826895 RepID=A0ABT6TFD9_9BACL|nr:GDSL-type esterase/lipase family protein [Cohnella hashimotonis]MDI4645559.1 GDSL-type esterase/lipase family protein [Cohnella hashimotonis]
MRRRKDRLWPVLGTVCLLCTALLLLGFGWALKDTWAPAKGLTLPAPTQAAPQTGGEWTSLPEIKAIAIGDSLTRGVGDVAGKGYVEDSLSQLSKSLGKPVRLNGNLAVSGLEAAGLDELLDGKAMQDAVADADLVLLTIGGNDLFRSSQQTGGSIAEGGGIDPELAKQRLPKTEERLKAVFTKLRALNPSVRIVYVALYNPFYELAQLRAPIASILADWNGYAVRTAGDDGNIVVVPTADMFQEQSARYLSSDHFHPNGAGYARIAVRVAQALN